MGYLGGFIILLLVTSAGALVSALPGFPLPGSVTGILIMVILLVSGLVKMRQVQKASGAMLKYLPLFFIPLVINVLGEGSTAAEYGLRIALVIIITTLITAAVTALTARFLFFLHFRLSGSRNDD